MKTISSNSPDLILRSPAQHSEAGRLEGWQLARSSVAILRDASLTRCSPGMRFRVDTDMLPNVGNAVLESS
jgi:hypothetical protein